MSTAFNHDRKHGILFEKANETEILAKFIKCTIVGQFIEMKRAQMTPLKDTTFSEFKYVLKRCVCLKEI